MAGIKEENRKQQVKSPLENLFDRKRRLKKELKGMRPRRVKKESKCRWRECKRKKWKEESKSKKNKEGCHKSNSWEKGY